MEVLGLKLNALQKIEQEIIEGMQRYKCTERFEHAEAKKIKQS